MSGVPNDTSLYKYISDLHGTVEVKIVQSKAEGLMNTAFFDPED